MQGMCRQTQQVRQRDVESGREAVSGCSACSMFLAHMRQKHACNFAAPQPGVCRSTEAKRRVRVDTYSLSKYSSVVQEVGGWDWLQRLLAVLDAVAQRRDTSIADVAQRWVLDRPQARSSSGVG